MTSLSQVKLQAAQNDVELSSATVTLPQAAGAALAALAGLTAVQTQEDDEREKSK